MLDKYTVPRVRPLLRRLAEQLHHLGVAADTITVAGFCIGLTTIPLLAFGNFKLALLALVLNRVADGLDGELARLHGATDEGGFLDITLDFVFYALFPLGFALYDPTNNALPTALLLACFVGTGTSFLAFATLADKRGIVSPDFSYKSLFYLNGLAEGTETIIFFILMCLLPGYFMHLALLFSVICLLTSINRIFFGYQTLKNNS